jgi:hypothetical protein
MDRLDSQLREVVHELAGQARSADLVAGALRQGRRRVHARRVAVAFTAGVAAVALVAVPALALRGGRPPADALSGGASARPSTSPTAHLSQPASDPTPTLTTGPLALPGGWIVGSATELNTNDEAGTGWVYDRGSRTYVKVPYTEVIPSPTGQYALVFDGVRARYGVLDIAHRTVTWPSIPTGKSGAYSAPAWSPDGRTFAVLSLPKYGTFSVYVIDAVTGQRRQLGLDWSRDYCSDFCFVSWYDSSTLALPHADPGSKANAPAYNGMHLFSAATGVPKGTVDLPGSYASPANWSPDHRYVVLATPESLPPVDNRIGVYDTQSHRVVGYLPGQSGAIDALAVFWCADDQMLITSATTVSLVGLDGVTIHQYPMPLEFSTEQWVILVKQ